MTSDEYRKALEALSPAQFEAYKSSWGGTAETIEKCVAEYAYSSVPEQWDRIVVYQLRKLGADVQTEQEKIIALARTSAEAAGASAAAAASSADSARTTARSAWYAVVISLVGIIATIVVQRGC